MVHCNHMISFTKSDKIWLAIEKARNGVSAVNSPWSGLPIMPLSQDCLFSRVQSHSVLSEPVSLTPEESLPSFGWHLFPSSWKVPKDIDFSTHTPFPPSV